MSGLVSYYFPFIQSETRHILESIIAESENYNDFVNRLASRVVSEQACSELVYIAVRHAVNISRFDLVDAIGRAFEDVTIIRPLVIPQRTWTEVASNRSRILEEVDRVCQEGLPPWLFAEMLLLRLKLAMFVEPEYSASLEEVKEFLEQRTELEYCQPVVDHFIAMTAAWTSDTETAKEYYLSAMAKARKLDNPLLLVEILMRYANLVKNEDAAQALCILEEASEISQALGAPYTMVDPLNVIGIVATFAGEYDLAFNSFLKAIQVSESIGVKNLVFSLNVANACNNLGLWEEAVRWAEMVLEVKDHMKAVEAHIYIARAMAELGLTEEASDHIDKADELVLRSGMEGLRGAALFVRGLLELAEGSTQTAIQTMELALEICSGTYQRIHVSQILISLVRIHLGHFRGEKSIPDAEKWLYLLERHAREHNLPGIIVEASLLRSEISVAVGEPSSARAGLEAILPICASRGLRSLQERVLDRLAEIRALGRN
jgi:tetratricopeptide (TPR) repeat protein